MTTCEQLSDRMPAVARGQSAWTPGERMHLEACPGCRREWELVRLTAGLGREWETRIDGARMARAVSARLAREGRRHQHRRRWTWSGVAALAAAAALALVFRAPWRPRALPARTGPVAAASGEFVIPVAGIDSLSADQLESVLETMDVPLISTTSVEAPSLQELDDQQLERVLRSLEG